jgi:membrane protease YdiL (CAAX protease family)
VVPVKPWSVEAVARLFVGVIATLCIGMILAGALGSSRFGIPSDRLEFLQMLVMIACFQGAALVWMARFLHESNMSWRQAFGLRPASRLKAILAGLAIGVMTLPLMWLLQLISEMTMEWMKIRPVTQAAVQELQSSSLSLTQKIVLGLFTILLAPIAEETLFRGVLYPAIKQSGHPRWALWGTSILFGVMHFNMSSLTSLVVLAVILTMIYEASETLLVPVAAHSMFNAANFFYLIFSDQIDAWLHIS